MSKTHKKCKKKGQKYTKRCSIFGFFLASFPQTYTHFVRHSDSLHQTKNVFVAVTQWTKQIFVAMSQCNKQFSISLWHVTKELGKKPKNKHPLKFEFHHRYQIALGTFQLLCWKSFKDYIHSVLKQQDKLCPLGPWAELLYFCVWLKTQKH